MAVRIPVQSLPAPVEDPVDRLARRGGGGEEERPREADAVRRQDQVAVARQDAHVVAVLVERVLPAPLADDAKERELARVHVGIAVVGLVRVRHRVARIHVVRH